MPTQRLQFLVVAHAMAVLLLGLIAGLMLTFSLLEAVALWPIPGWEVQVFGTTRGWQAAHVGGILNAVMMVALIYLVTFLNLAQGPARWVGWGMIVTGWGNTLFYWAGNLAANRGLSAAATPFGPGDIWGVLAYLGGGTAMFATFIAVILLLQAAYRKYAE